MSSEAEKIAVLEAKSFKQEDVIVKLGERQHEIELKLCEFIGTLDKIDDSQVELKIQVNDHMNKEEGVIQAIYDRILSMDIELKKSFKTRDEKITELRIGQEKLFAYAVAAFTVISVAVQLVVS